MTQKYNTLYLLFFTSEKSTIESGPCPPSAASVKKRKTRVDGLPDPAASRTKKYKSPKLGPSKENNRHESSSKEMYPDLEKHPLRDAPRPDDQVPLMIVSRCLFGNFVCAKL